MENKKTITIDGIDYVRADSISEINISKSYDAEGRPFCIIRTYSAGVFAGYIESREGKEGVIRNAIRIWYWDGAASLSQMSVEGVSKPENCKFAVPVDKIILTEIIEVLECTEKAEKSIKEVKPWKK